MQDGAGQARICNVEVELKGCFELERKLKVVHSLLPHPLFLVVKRQVLVHILPDEHPLLVGCPV